MVARACSDETSHTRNNLNGRSLGQFIKVTLCHLSAFSIPRFAISAFFGCPFGGISRLDFEILWSFPFHIPSAFYHSVCDSAGSAHGTSAFPSITSIFLHSFRSVFDFLIPTPISPFCLVLSAMHSILRRFRYTHFRQPGLFFMDLVIIWGGLETFRLAGLSFCPVF
jgi:hypothetical protein